MKKLRIFFLVAVMILSVLLPSNVAVARIFYNADTDGNDTSAEILVKFKSNTTASEIAQIHRQNGGRMKGTISALGVQVVTVPWDKVKEKVRAYSANGKVLYAEPDYIAEAVDSPDDTYLNNQWGLKKVEATSAWELTKGSSTIKIAILDTGVDFDHPDLINKLVNKVNFTTSPTSDDVYGHGTHVAGIAAASTNNAMGVAGLGYDSTLMSVKVLGDDGYGAYSWIAQGIVWAADNGAKVINLSLGGSSASSTLESAVDYAWSKGAIVVAAAGNSGSSSPFYPAYYNKVIAVAATDQIDNLPSWSNYGNWVDIAAPGNGIYSTKKNGSYGYMTGTSMATPFVSGLASLVFTVVSDTNGNKLLNDEVRTRIETTCDELVTTKIDCGRINAYNAVYDGTMPSPEPEPVPTPVGTIRGTVTDSMNPVVGASITDGTGIATTDNNGYYTITEVPEGDYTVTASASGFLSTFQQITVAGDETTTVNFVLNKIIQYSSISGQVIDEATRLGIAGARVTDGIRTVTAASDGSYTILEVPAGIYTVTASAAGYNSASRSVSVGENEVSSTADFSLTPISKSTTVCVSSISYYTEGGKNKDQHLRISVALTDNLGNPVTGASVSITVSRNGKSYVSITGTTGLDGETIFRLNNAPSGTYISVIEGVNVAGSTWDGVTPPNSFTK
jgi:thermitase